MLNSSAAAQPSSNQGAASQIKARRDSTGHDILWFDEDGPERPIEIKAFSASPFLTRPLSDLPACLPACLAFAAVAH
jgi:hypothetical protein